MESCSTTSRRPLNCLKELPHCAQSSLQSLIEHAGLTIVQLGYVPDSDNGPLAQFGDIASRVSISKTTFNSLRSRYGAN